MSALTFDVLALLVSLQGQKVTLEVLMDEIWQNKIVGPETVTQRIAMLRKALNSNSGQATEYIESIRGEGYRWVPSVENTEGTDKTTRPVKIYIVLTTVVLGALIVWFNRAHLFIQQENPAETQLELQLDPIEESLQQANRYFNRFTKTSTEQAIQLFQQVLQQDPNSIEAMNGLSSAYAQMVSKFNGSGDLLFEAERIARKAVGLAPENSDSIATLGFVLDVQGRINAAIDHYEQALELQPDNLGLKGGLAYLYGVSGDLVNALRLDVSAFSGQQSYRHLQIARTLHLLEFNTLAERWYQMADELNPDSVFAATARAEFYLSQGQLQQAKKIALAALDRNIQRSELHLVLAQVALLQQQPQQAQLAFAQAKQTNAGTTKTRVWKIWSDSVFGSQQIKLDLPAEIDGLKQYLLQHIDRGDHWSDLHEYLAILAMVENNSEEAINQLQLAFTKGSLDADRLLQLPIFNTLKTHPEFLQLIEDMRNEVQRQRQIILTAEWLPEDFLNSGSR